VSKVSDGWFHQYSGGVAPTWTLHRYDYNTVSDHSFRRNVPTFLPVFIDCPNLLHAVLVGRDGRDAFSAACRIQTAPCENQRPLTEQIPNQCEYVTLPMRHGSTPGSEPIPIMVSNRSTNTATETVTQHH